MNDKGWYQADIHSKKVCTLLNIVAYSFNCPRPPLLAGSEYLRGNEGWRWWTFLLVGIRCQHRYSCDSGKSSYYFRRTSLRYIHSYIHTYIHSYIHTFVDVCVYIYLCWLKASGFPKNKCCPVRTEEPNLFGNFYQRCPTLCDFRDLLKCIQLSYIIPLMVQKSG